MNMLFNSRNVRWNGLEYEELPPNEDECELQSEVISAEDSEDENEEDEN
jgi:hypothetical protein